MKKIYLLLFVLVSAAVSAQTLLIPDAEFKSKLIAMGIDANNDGEIQFLEAQVVTEIHFDGGTIQDLFGINNFINLTELRCSNNQITGLLDLSNLVNLRELDVNNNQITGLNLSNLSNLEGLFCANNAITALDLSDNTSLEFLYCPDNEIAAVVWSAALKSISIGYNNLAAIDVTGIPGLQQLHCNFNTPLVTLDASGLTDLFVFQCQNNPVLTAIDVSGCTALNDVSSTGNTSLASLNISGCTGLEYIICADSQLTTLDASNLPTLLHIACNNNLLANLDISGSPALEYLRIDHNQLASIDLSGCPSLETLMCNDNLLASVNASNKANLAFFNCSNNPELVALDLSGCPMLPGLYLNSLGQLATLDVSGCTAMAAIQCGNNVLTTLDVSGMPNLNNLQCQNNQLATLNLTGCSGLQYLEANNNQLAVLDVSDSAGLIQLSIANNNLQAFDASMLVNLEQMLCQQNELVTLDLSNSPLLESLNCNTNPMESLFIKNGAIEEVNFPSSLVYVCADEPQVADLQALFAELSMAGTVCNSYCTFVPGGSYNTITGSMIFDADNNGCTTADILQPFVKVVVSNGTSEDAIYTDDLAHYNYYTGIGDFTITPGVEIPAYFNFSPASGNVNFPDTNENVFTLDFCMTANGIQPDVEIVIAPFLPARPGFPAIYKVVYKNKGNQTVSGTIAFEYNDNIMDYNNSTTIPASQATGLLNYNYTGLQPFENREFSIVMDINAPTDTPAVNIDDILNFTATVNLASGTDALPADNIFVFNQTVVGSYDPNDKYCMEGEVVSPTEIGEYLHYIINFENTGTDVAENVVVSDTIDESMFDVGSLQIMNSSHELSARVTGNKAEFIFQGINLEIGGHGNILLKIKTKDNLVNGDQVINKADIFFDYNHPIATNPARTTFQSLGVTDPDYDGSIVIYPNPAHDIVNISANSNIKSIQLYDIQGRILQTSVVNDMEAAFDISRNATGVYFLKITSENGIRTEKIIKK